MTSFILGQYQFFISSDAIRCQWGEIQPMKPVMTNQNCEQNNVSISTGGPTIQHFTLLNASMTLEDPPSLLHSSTPPSGQVGTSGHGRREAHQDLSVFQCFHTAVMKVQNGISHTITHFLQATCGGAKAEPISNPRCFSWIHPTSHGGSLWGLEEPLQPGFDRFLNIKTRWQPEMVSDFIRFCSSAPYTLKWLH